MSDINVMQKGWAECNIGELVELAQGVAINAKTNYVLSDKKNGIPLLKINNLLNNTVDQYANPDLVPKQSIINKNDVIFTRTGQVGEVLTNKYGILHNNSFKVIPNEKLYWNYLYWYLKSRKVYNYVQKVAAGSVQKDLNHSAFKTILFKYPENIDEQKSIANILTAFDDKIELLQQQNQTLEALAQTIFKEWFGKYQVGDELPDGWRIGKLGKMANLKSGYAFKSNDFVELNSKKALKIKDLKGNGRVDLSDISSVSDEITAISRVKYFKLNAGDIVIAMSGNTTGKIGVVPPHSNEVYLNQRVGKFFMVDDKLNSFLYSFLMSGNYEEKILSMGYGSAQPNISPSQIEDIDIIYPDNETIKKFSDISNPIFQKVLDNNALIQSLTKTRDALLPKLMSGQVRVKM
ncbi:MAG: restriction endonuclease subunit S [Lutibacter sp.]|nr:restriction endonuclease subunit S [Lutibacter sp.]